MRYAVAWAWLGIVTLSAACAAGAMDDPDAGAGGANADAALVDGAPPAADATTPAADATTPAPDATTPAPDATTPAPDATTPTPDAMTSALDAMGPTPDAMTSAPDAMPPAPDAMGPTPDAMGPTPDAMGPTPDAAGPDAALPPWIHAIAVDGVNDFDSASEQFLTTTTSYAAFVTWDDDNLYIGYDGDDVGSGHPAKWLHVYLDTTLGVATGATAGELYNTQRVGFPSGFRAEYYYRWKASDDFHDLRAYDAGGGSWSTIAAPIDPVRSGNFVEIAIPWSSIGDPDSAGIVALWLNEDGGHEWSYAGLYLGSFIDGYFDADASLVPVHFYLAADRASPRAPNDIANRRP